jgi:hypothetical protein
VQSDRQAATVVHHRHRAMDAIQLELPLGLPLAPSPGDAPPQGPQAAPAPAPRLDEQEFAAIVNARLLLQRLVDPQLTPRVPRDIRAEARALLRWLPAPMVLRKKLEPILPWRVSLRANQNEGCQSVAGERVFKV